MVIYNPKKPGDVIYTQYSMIQTFPIKEDQAIVKGNIYTMEFTSAANDTDGYLQAPTADSNAADLQYGIFQAMADVAAPSATGEEGDGARTVQCLLPPSYILLKAPAGIVPGQRVKLSTPTATSVDLDKVEVIGTTDIIPKDYLGRVLEIYTRNTSDTTVRKTQTADDDLIIVKLGVV